MRSRRSGNRSRGPSRLARVAVAVVVLVTAPAPAMLAAPVAADPSVAVDYEGDRVTVANGTAQVVSGTAEAPAGTEVLVRVRSSGDTDPIFLKSRTAVVTGNGTWAVAFDFAEQSAGDAFTLTARTENGSAETGVGGEVVACGGDCAETPPSDTPTPIPEQTPTSTPTSTPTAGPDPSVAFGENVFLADSGGVTAVPVTFDGADADEAVIVVGNETESNYELEAVVTNGDGDGEAILYVDTSLTGHGGGTVSASGGDSVTVDSETSLDDALDPASYDVSLYAGGERAGTPADIGTLVVQEPVTPTPTAGTSATPTGEPTDAGGAGLGSVPVGGLVSGAFLIGGAVLAAVLLKG